MIQPVLMAVTTSSRSGAHVTLAFTVHSDSDDPLEQGSYGVGLCLEAGLSTSCRSDPSASMGVTVIINGDPSNEELQREVLLECIKFDQKEMCDFWEKNELRRRLAETCLPGQALDKSGQDQILIFSISHMLALGQTV